MRQESRRVRNLTHGALIAALYCVLTYASALFSLASGPIQFRLSEMLTILPYFTPAAVPGLFIGCALANLLTGAAVWDVVFGALATLLGALGTRALRRKNRYLASLPPIVSNTLIVPLVLQHVYGAPDAYPYLCLTVFLGECVTCALLGTVLLRALEKRRNILFGEED